MRWKPCRRRAGFSQSKAPNTPERRACRNPTFTPSALAYAVRTTSPASDYPQGASSSAVGQPSGPKSEPNFTGANTGNQEMLDGLCLLRSERAWSRVLEVVLLQPLPSLALTKQGEPQEELTPWRSLGFAVALGTPH
jgi:hypothetical protein